MKFIIILAVVLLFVGCGSEFFRVDDNGTSPAVRAAKTARVFNAVSSPVNPLAVTIDAVLLSVIALLTRSNKKTKQAGVATVKKYTVHKKVMESIMREATNKKATEIYDAIGEERKKLGL